MRREEQFHKGAYQHVYQITSDGGIAFYDAIDCLVYFTEFCVKSQQYNVEVDCVAIMRNHLHFGLRANELRDISLLIGSSASYYTRSFNKKGRLKVSFKTYDRDEKIDSKQRRNNIIYIANNPVEKKACSKAIEYKWNFLAYSNNSNPFSICPVISKSSIIFRNAISCVRLLHQKRKPLNYYFFNSIMPKLNSSEKLQLVDYIISTYSVINHKATEAEFKSREDMIIAINSTTGSEYNIHEEFSKEDYKHYNEIGSMISKMGGNNYFLNSPERLITDCYLYTNASPFEISRYFHLDIGLVKSVLNIR